MKKEIKIPDIAENVETGLIAGILVSKGDKIDEDQSVVEIETDKATTDIPSSFAGVVDEIKVKEGDEVKVNQVIMIIETEDEGDGEEKDKEDEGGEEKGKETKDKEKDTDEEKEEGKKESEEEEEKEEDKKKKDESAEEEDKKKEAKQQVNDEKEAYKDLSDVPASPSVRRLAREMDVDITKVKGTGPGNRISAEDVKKHAGKSEAAPAEEAAPKAIELPDFSQWGTTSREPMTNIRKITSKNVQQAWQTIPHVTQFDEADITELENFRKRFQSKAEKAGGKLTVTAILLKIAGFALQKFPRFNASIDANSNEIIYKHYYNVGIAADTPKGLLVPVVQDVNSKSLIDLSVELTELAEKARNKKISPDEMQGGNFTISNLGGIGGTAFTPIVLPPQVAILGVARSQYKPVYVNGELEKRLIIPLSLSYDHRIIDGADGARFLRWICDVIEDPYAILQ
jgi:pyruvate dehydrogenase E2 component (dihydrolipoamide acetyltransferase)